MKKTKRVLHIIAGMHQGGAENVIMNIYRNIDRDLVQFDFAVVDNIAGYFDNEIVQLGGRLFIIKQKFTGTFSGSFNPLSYLIGLISIVKKNGPFCAIHSHNNNFTPIAMFVGFICGIPIRIAHSHNGGSMVKHGRFLSVEKELTKIIIKLFATICIGCSSNACRYLFGENCLNNGTAKIIYNGIDYDIFNIKHYNKEEAQKSLNIPINVLNFIYVGRISTVKNTLFLINVFASLYSIRKDVHLTMVANVNFLDQDSVNVFTQVNDVIKRENLNNAVTILEPRSDIAFVLAAMDAFLLPSISEGFPMVLIESQSMGVKCFVSDTISQEVNLGLCEFIPINKSESLWVKRINDWITSHMEKEAIIQKLFNIKQITKTYLDIYLCNLHK